MTEKALHQKRVLVEVMLTRITQMSVFDQAFQLFGLRYVLMQVRVVHCRFHIDKSVRNPHVFTVHNIIFLCLLLDAPLLNEASGELFTPSPLLVVHVLSLLLTDQGSDDMLVLLESEPSLHD